VPFDGTNRSVANDGLDLPEGLGENAALRGALFARPPSL
jgi:hypothetical protein